MSDDLILKPTCSGCGSTRDLYGSNCKHLTICIPCGKTMAENRTKCYECGATITRLIREYRVRASSSSDKKYFIGRFVSGLPCFSKKRKADKWFIRKEGLQGCQLSDALREKYKNKPLLLEDESGQFQYHGVLEGVQSAGYFLLMLQGKEFVAIPAGSWYNFNKVPQYKQLTLEEAEEKMKNRRKTADGYERWMMKAANNGAAAFGEVENFGEKENGVSGGRGRKKLTSGDDDDEANTSDKGEEGEEEESVSKNRLGLGKKDGGGGDEEGPRGGDFDFVDDIEKGDDWEHVEIFTDDDEAVGNDLEEWEDLAAEIPAPPEMKQDDEDEEELDGKGGGLSNSGKELKKLLGRTTGINESDEDDDYDEEDDDGFGTSAVLAPKQKYAPKEELNYSNPLGSAHSSSISKSANRKRRKTGGNKKSTTGAPSNIAKTENEANTMKEETAATSRSSGPARGTSAAPRESWSSSAAGLVSENEVRAVLLQNIPMTTKDLVAIFKSRVESKEEKLAFIDLVKRICTTKYRGPRYVVLREKCCS